MDVHEVQRVLTDFIQELSTLFHRVPGSAILLRYVKSSYQNDPIRSAVELFLFLFAVRYLLAPKYSTKPGIVKLSEEEIDDLVDEWTPEPLVGSPTALEEVEVEKRTVIVGYATFPRKSDSYVKHLLKVILFELDRPVPKSNCRMGELS
jgi:serine palmitoyltransferase